MEYSDDLVSSEMNELRRASSTKRYTDYDRESDRKWKNFIKAFNKNDIELARIEIELNLLYNDIIGMSFYLKLAVKEGKYEMAKLLIKKGAHPTLETLKLAKQTYKRNIITLIEDKLMKDKAKTSQYCEYIDSETNLEELRRISKFLGFSTKNKTKAQLCKYIADHFEEIDEYMKNY